MFTTGIGICFAFAVIKFPDAAQFITWIRRPLLFISGVMYSLTMIPLTISSLPDLESLVALP